MQDQEFFKSLHKRKLCKQYRQITHQASNGCQFSPCLGPRIGCFREFPKFACVQTFGNRRRLHAGNSEVGPNRKFVPNTVTVCKQNLLKVNSQAFWASDFTCSFTSLLITFVVNKPANFGHLFSLTYCRNFCLKIALILLLRHFWTSNFSSLKQRKGNNIYKLTQTWNSECTSYKYSMWQRTNVRGFVYNKGHRHVKLHVKSDAQKVPIQSKQ